MDKDTIMELAREAGLSMYCAHRIIETNFVALVTVQVEATWQHRYLRLNDLMQARESQPNKSCCLAEREACAKIAQAWDVAYPKTNYGQCIANEIRSRT